MKLTKLTLALALCGLAPLAACGDDGPPVTPDAAKLHDAGVDAPSTPDASCFDNPVTHEQIINACTTAQKIFKDSHPALLNPDGSLPPLPI